MNLPLLITFFSVISNFVIGLFIFFKNRNSDTNRYFFALTILLALYLSTNQFTLTQTTNQTVFTGVKIVMSLAALINWVFFCLVSVFPEKKLNLNKFWYFITLIFTVILSFAAQFNLIFTSIEVVDGGTSSQTGPLMPLFLLQTITLLGAGFFQLIRKYKKAKEVTRLQIKFILSASFFMFTSILITNLLAVVIFDYSQLTGLLPLYTTMFAGIIAYTIIRHRLLDIRLIVARAVAFSLLLLTTVTFLAVLLLSLPQFLAQEYHTFATIFLAIVLAFAFNPIRKILERLTEKLLHQNSYDPDMLLEQLAESIRSSVSLDRITKNIMKQLETTLHPTKGTFFIIDEESEKITVKNFDYSPIPNLDKSVIKKLASKAKKTLLLNEEVEDKHLKDLLQENDISVVVPLIAGTTLHGLMILGPKESGEIYNSQDLNVLEILGPQLSIGVQNSLSYDEIKQFNITLKDKVKYATKDLRKANKHLRELDKLKDEFVYIATHELKTPVTVIKGYLAMIEDKTYGDIPEKIKEPLEEIKSASQQLQLLVNDILDIARSESKGIKFDTKPSDLCSVITDVVSNLKSLAREKGLDIKYETDECLMVMADPDRLKEVVNNLLTNAIKYSQKGEILISHSLDKDAIITHVKDQGFGMSDADQKKLFTRFFRSEDHANEVPGTGLGLFIVKQLVEKMGGRIWFSSKLGVGTTFSFSLNSGGLGK